MKLTDLDPEWLTPDMFIFRNPTGGNYWLTCKRSAIDRMAQYDLIYGPKNEEGKYTGKYKGKHVVLTVPEMAWKFEGNDFSNLTVTPSIDASASGNWHGFITNGEIT